MTTTRSTPSTTDDMSDALAGQVKEALKTPGRRSASPTANAKVAPVDGSPAAPVETFTDMEVARLAELETIVDTSFAAIGSALMEIHDSRLYRNTHKSFEDYVAERFGFSRQWADRQIAAARVLALASPMGDITTERQARELRPLLDDPTAMREAIDAASVDGQRPTAERLRKEVKKRTNDAAVSESNARRGKFRIETLSEYIAFDLAEFLADPDVAKLRNDSGYAIVTLDNRPKQIETCIETDLAKAAAQRRKAASKKRETAHKLVEEADLDDEVATTLDAIDAKTQPLFRAAKDAKAADRAAKRPPTKRSS